MLEHLDELVVKRGVPAEGPGAGVRPNARASAREATLAADDARAARGLRRAGAGGAVDARRSGIGHRLEPRPIVLRTYVAAAGDSYRGDARRPDARVEHAATCRSSRCSAAAGSKDTWVLPTVRSARVRCWRPPAPIGWSAATTRAAEPRGRQSVLARPLRRARGAHRAAAAQHRRRAWPTRIRPTIRVRAVGAAAGAGRPASCCPSELGEHDAAARARRGHARPHRSGRARTPACATTLNELRRLASVVRDRLSIDTWRILNQLHQDIRLRHGPHPVRRRARRT